MHTNPSPSSISIRTFISALCALALLSAILPASADPKDGWKEREGRGEQKCEEKYNARKGEYKLECKGDGYKYKYRADRNGYKEEWHGMPPPPRWAPPACAVVPSGEPQAVYYGPMNTDVGIYQGTCTRSTVGTLLGGALGGVAGAQIGKGKGRRTAATIAGTLLGIYVGNNLGRSPDEADRYCTGQVLEQATIDGRTQNTYGTACRQLDGSWQIVQQSPGNALHYTLPVAASPLPIA